MNISLNLVKPQTIRPAKARFGGVSTERPTTGTQGVDFIEVGIPVLKPECEDKYQKQGSLLFAQTDEVEDLPVFVDDNNGNDLTRWKQATIIEQTQLKRDFAGRLTPPRKVAFVFDLNAIKEFDPKPPLDALLKEGKGSAPGEPPPLRKKNIIRKPPNTLDPNWQKKFAHYLQNTPLKGKDGTTGDSGNGGNSGTEGSLE